LNHDDALAWTVENQIVVFIISELFFQPVHILEQIPELQRSAKTSLNSTEKSSTHSLEAVDQTTIRTIVQLVHDILQADEIANVNCWLVLERVVVRRRVEVDEMSGAF
jgi:hypothetical protein